MAGCKYTNYERLRPKTVDDMVEIVYANDEMLDGVCKKMSQGDCPHGDSVTSADCKNCVKEWLLRESDE